jgi:hypothetical protein
VQKKRKKLEVVPSPSPPHPEPLSRHLQFIDGIIQVQDLDIEELQRARIKNWDGGWNRGPAPKMPGGLLQRIQRELNTRLLAEFNKYGIDAIETITDVMYRGEGASAFQGQKDGTKRLDAAKYVLERIVGPMPTKSEISTSVTLWEGIQEEGSLFVDIEAEEIYDEPETTPPARTRGPRTRRSRPKVEDV